MNKTLQDIKKATKDLLCPKHKEKPKVKMVKEEIQLTTCCDAFRKKVTTAANKAYNKSIEEQILNMFL